MDTDREGVTRPASRPVLPRWESLPDAKLEHWVAHIRDILVHWPGGDEKWGEDDYKRWREAWSKAKAEHRRRDQRVGIPQVARADFMVGGRGVVGAIPLKSSILGPRSAPDGRGVGPGPESPPGKVPVALPQVLVGHMPPSRGG